MLFLHLAFLHLVRRTHHCCTMGSHRVKIKICIVSKLNFKFFTLKYIVLGVEIQKHFLDSQKLITIEHFSLSSAFKFKWLLDNDADVRNAMNDDRLLFGNVDSWIIWNLTGGVNGGVDNHVTDVTNASRTMLMDLNVC